MTTGPSSAVDEPPPLGLRVCSGVGEVAVYAGHADAVDLCLFEPGDTTGASERRIPLRQRSYGVFYDTVEGLHEGQRYGFRAHGRWAPDEGLRHNPSKLLLDPYARAVEGEVRWSPAVFAQAVGDDWTPVHGDVPSALDSAAFVPRAVVVRDEFDWGAVESPRRSRADSLIYEVHVREQTRLMPGVPEHLRGTYAGLASDASIAYLHRLGVTAVELLPVQLFTDEPHLVQLGLENHWGYNTLGFFAPHPAYAAATDPQGVLDEFKGMVKLLHAAGIEVILDVVYNHTCEQGRHGATLSWRGLDNRAYYRLGQGGHDIDVTGCGNTLDLAHPVVAQMVLDSLRYWATECRVDGFRFDLAVALARGKDGEYDPDHPFLVALRTDPVLRSLKLIAEPWDIGPFGWRTGQFPPPFAEWNDKFRDASRTFWLADQSDLLRGRPGHGIQELATRLAGSQDVFGARDRGPVASINFHCAHDGFTAADLTAYDIKHNEANLEGNRDGSSHNLSWNHGVEGDTDDEWILLRRRRSQRNLMATTLLATGVPMIVSGDESGRSFSGNNNTYCQPRHADPQVTDLRWDLEPWQEDMVATTAHLAAIRRDHAVLRQRRFFSGRAVHEDGSSDLSWWSADGRLLEPWQWEDPRTRTVQMLLSGAWLGYDSVLIVCHGGLDDVEVRLPDAPGVRGYTLLWDSAWERPAEAGPPVHPGLVPVSATSVQVYRVTDPT